MKRKELIKILKQNEVNKNDYLKRLETKYIKKGKIKSFKEEYLNGEGDELKYKFYSPISSSRLCFELVSYNFMVENGEEYDESIINTLFDVVLQYSMLQIATVDNCVDENEILFIKEMAQTGDFVDFVNDMAGTNGTWEDFLNMEISDFRKRIKGAEQVMRDVSGEITGAMVYVEQTFHQNYISEIEQNVTRLLTGLASVDEYIDDEEFEVETIIETALDKAQKLVGTISFFN